MLMFLFDLDDTTDMMEDNAGTMETDDTIHSVEIGKYCQDYYACHKKTAPVCLSYFAEASSEFHAGSHCKNSR